MAKPITFVVSAGILTALLLVLCVQITPRQFWAEPWFSPGRGKNVAAVPTQIKLALFGQHTTGPFETDDGYPTGIRIVFVLYYMKFELN